MRCSRKIVRRFALVGGGLFLICLTVFLMYFPGRQSLLAITLATGFGVDGLQERVDSLEDKAITGQEFTKEDKDFLKNLYACFAKGARVTIVLRQSAQLMDHYLAGSGDDLQIGPRVFLGSREVQEQIALLKSEISSDLHRGHLKEEYASPTFYMADPEFFESYVALYYGRMLVRPRRLVDGTVSLQCRAEMPWQWPSYESLYAEYGDYHAQCFSLPNALSLLQGPRYSLRMDDGLGEYLAQIGLAKPFMVRSEWHDSIDPTIDKGQQGDSAERQQDGVR